MRQRRAPRVRDRRASGKTGWALAALTLAALALLAVPAAAAAGLRAAHVYVDPGATAILSEQDAVAPGST